MKIYLLTLHSVSGGVTTQKEHRAFADKTKAQKALKKWVNKEIKYVEDAEWIVYTNKPDEFEAYDFGDYNDNHSVGYIETIEVE